MHHLCRGRALVALVVSSVLVVERGAAAPGDLVAFFSLPFSAPQDIAYDEEDGTYWISSFLDQDLHHYSSDLQRELGTIPLPFSGLFFSGATGIACNSRDRTLLVADHYAGEIVEIDKQGTPTGRLIQLPEKRGERDTGPGGIAFDPFGDANRGSVFVTDLIGDIIDEFSLGGELLRSFPAIDNPQRFLGAGTPISLKDAEPIREAGSLVGFYATVSAESRQRLLRLDLEGNYTGVSIPLDASGGNVSSALRVPFADPDTDETIDAYLTVVDSKARLALLEGGEPTFREIFALACERSQRTVSLTWRTPQTYDSVEVLRGCEVVATLDGSASSWEGTLETDGIYSFFVRARAGVESTETKSCTIVVGAGEIIREVDVDNEAGHPRLGDIALVRQDVLAVVASNRELALFDLELERVGTVTLSEFFVPPGEDITGIAYGGEPETVFVYNTTSSKLAKFSLSGDLLLSFDVLGTEGVGGMTYYPSGNRGRGSLLLVETARDAILEIDVTGRVLREVPHPLLAFGRPPEDADFGPDTGGISMVAGSGNLLYLSGGTLREGFESRIFLYDLDREAMLRHAEIPTLALGGRDVNVQHVLDGGASRLFVTVRGKLLEVEHRSPIVAAPSILRCAVVERKNVELAFVNNGPYDGIEVFRDCTVIATLTGTAETFTDTAVAPGVHEYTLRAFRADRASDLVTCSLRVGPGAVLQRAFAFPVSHPRLMTRDPLEGSIYIFSKSEDGHEVARFDRTLVYQESRKIEVPVGRILRGIAARQDPLGRPLLCCLMSEGGTRFWLRSELVEGSLVNDIEIFPPRLHDEFFISVSGLMWSPEADLFYFHESNNTDTFLEMEPGGRILRRFHHPDPVVRSSIFAGSAAFASARGTLFVAAGESALSGVTKLAEMRLDGSLTGVEIPFLRRETGLNDVGVAFAENDLIVVGSGVVRGEILRLEAFAPQAMFLRGDTDADSKIRLNDPVSLLNYLFLGREGPACQDAADSDDNGRLDLTDAVYTLSYLFLGGPAPPPPFPGVGADPTRDGLECETGS